MNNVNQAVKNFKRKSDERLDECYSQTKEKFHPPAFEDSSVQERIMRIGIEARTLNASNEDEFYMIALATLQNDFVRTNSKT